MDPKREFESYLDATLKSGAAPGLCVSDKELIDHLSRTTDGSGRELMEQHLVSCPDCRQRLLELRDFLNPIREGEEPITDRSVREDWRKLRRRLENDAPRKFVWSLGFALQAVSITAILALTIGWVLTTQQAARERVALRSRAATLERQLAALEKPRIDSAIHDVYPVQSLTRSGEPSRVNQIDATRDTLLTLILNGQGQPAFPRYSVTITDSNGRPLWRAEGLKRNAEGNFVITLGSGFLRDGQYRLHIEPGLDYIVTITSHPPR